DERRHPSEQHHERRPSQEAGGAAEDRGQFLQDKGVKGSGRPDGVLRRALLRRPAHHPGAHLREPFQGEEVLLRSALRAIRDPRRLRVHRCTDVCACTGVKRPLLPGQKHCIIQSHINRKV
ncbi:unnamed protein product, partial [Tetraodon nigroviridis]